MAQQTSMTDREIIESIPELEIHESDNNFMVRKRGDQWDMQTDWCATPEEAAAEFFKNEAAFLWLDDALAARGYLTELCMRESGGVQYYYYRVLRLVVPPESSYPRREEWRSGTGSTRNKAVRSVYESILSSQQPTEIERLKGLQVPDSWLIWSNQHRSYWRPNSRGYCYDIEIAGRYPLEYALDICREANYGMKQGQNPAEIVAPSPELIAAFRLFSQSLTNKEAQG